MVYHYINACTGWQLVGTVQVETSLQVLSAFTLDIIACSIKERSKQNRKKSASVSGWLRKEKSNNPKSNKRCTALRVCRCVCLCICSSHASRRHTGWDGGYVWMASSSCFKSVSLYPLWKGEVRLRPCAPVSHPFSPEGNRLSPSRSPSIPCCPFVLDSIHRSWKERHLFSLSLSLILFLSLCGLIKLSCVRLYPLAAYSSWQCYHYLIHTHTRTHTPPRGRLQVGSSCLLSSTNQINQWSRSRSACSYQSEAKWVLCDTCETC